MTRSCLLWLSLLLLFCLFSPSLSQPDMPEMPGMGDMGDDVDMFELQGAEAFEEPVTFASSRKSAPVTVKKAPPMRAITYAYEVPETHFETVEVPTTKTRLAPVIEFSKEPVTSKKGGGGYGGYSGGYAGRGLWHTSHTSHTTASNQQLPGITTAATTPLTPSPLSLSAVQADR